MVYLPSIILGSLVIPTVFIAFRRLYREEQAAAQQRLLDEEARKLMGRTFG